MYIQTDTGGETARAKLVLMMCDLEMIPRGSENTTTYWQRATWLVTRTDRNPRRFWLGHVNASVWPTLSSSWCSSPNTLLRTTLVVRFHNSNSLIAGSVSLVTVLLSSAEAFEYMTLDLNKVPGQGLGLSIVGRRWDCALSDVCVVSILEWYWLLHCLSFSFLFNLTLCDFLFRNDTGVFVSDVVNGGVAEADGRLQPGDQILSVNGEDLSNATQEIAAGVLKVSYYDWNLLLRFRARNSRRALSARVLAAHLPVETSWEINSALDPGRKAFSQANLIGAYVYTSQKEPVDSGHS